jgi:lysophospholipase L1-like esterase
MVGGLLRFALAVVAVLAVVAGALEVGLRAAGAGPRAAGELSHIVPDGWTGFRLRPDVSGEEPFVTNDLGLHAPRSYGLAPRPGTLRIAVLGSSVAYGMGMALADTIPAAVERELQAAGYRPEVLNFGTHAFTIVNVSAQLQAYVHQFQPHVAVVVVDLQVGLPDWPALRPGAGSADERVAKLGWWEALRKRGSERSAVLTLFDNPRPARRWIRVATGLPLRPRSRPAADRRREARSPLPARPIPTAAPARPTASSAESVPAYERRRERELAAPLAAMAAFAAERSIALYFVTPYGPYFDVTEEELAHMSVRGFLEEPSRVYGSERAALAAEVELITRVARRVAARGSAHVIDLLEASRSSSHRTSSHFTEDGMHLSPEGNAALGELIAARVARDLDRRSGDDD